MPATDVSMTLLDLPPSDDWLDSFSGGDEFTSSFAPLCFPASNINSNDSSDMYTDIWDPDEKAPVPLSQKSLCLNINERHTPFRFDTLELDGLQHQSQRQHRRHVPYHKSPRVGPVAPAPPFDSFFLNKQVSTSSAASLFYPTRQESTSSLSSNDFKYDLDDLDQIDSMTLDSMTLSFKFNTQEQAPDLSFYLPETPRMQETENMQETEMKFDEKFGEKFDEKNELSCLIPVTSTVSLLQHNSPMSLPPLESTFSGTLSRSSFDDDEYDAVDGSGAEEFSEISPKEQVQFEVIPPMEQIQIVKHEPNSLKSSVTSYLNEEPNAEYAIPLDPVTYLPIGSYTRYERAAKIARYQEKKTRARAGHTNYVCRRKFANNRPRYQGRFLKMEPTMKEKLKRDVFHNGEDPEVVKERLKAVKAQAKEESKKRAALKRKLKYQQRKARKTRSPQTPTSMESPPSSPESFMLY